MHPFFFLVIVNGVLLGDYYISQLEVLFLSYMDLFYCTAHVESVVLLTKVHN